MSTAAIAKDLVRAEMPKGVQMMWEEVDGMHYVNLLVSHHAGQHQISEAQLRDLATPVFAEYVSHLTKTLAHDLAGVLRETAEQLEAIK